MPSFGRHVQFGWEHTQGVYDVIIGREHTEHGCKEHTEHCMIFKLLLAPMHAMVQEALSRQLRVTFVKKNKYSTKYFST